MTPQELIRELQRGLNARGAKLALDGFCGPETTRALSRFKVEFVFHPKAVVAQYPTPLEWARGELGQAEVAGPNDNPRIRWYHSHSANIGSREHPDEVPWCSSFLNAAADETGYLKTDNALAISWAKYGNDSGDYVDEGDIVVLKSGNSHHVTLANHGFARKKAKTFEGLGGNQSNAVKVSHYQVAAIVAARKWVKV